MDVKFIGSGRDARSVSYYITDYITKDELTTNNIIASLAKSKIVSNNNSNIEQQADATEASRRMAIKCLNRINCQTELSGPMAVALLLGFGDHYKSEQFSRLYAGPFLSDMSENVTESDNQVESEAYDLVVDGINMRVVNQKTDYLCRGSSLGNLSLYEYVSTIIKSKKSQKVCSEIDKNINNLGRKPFPRHSFSETHPQFPTHEQRKRGKPVVPTLSYIPPLKSANPEEHAKWVLLLFVPFTNTSDLKMGKSSWAEALDFALTENKIGVNCHAFLKNLDDMHGGLIDKAESMAEKNLKEQENHNFTKCNTAVDDIVPFDEELESGGESDGDAELQSDVVSPFIDEAIKSISRYKEIAFQSIQQPLVDSSSPSIIPGQTEPFTKSHIEFFKKEILRQREIQDQLIMHPVVESGNIDQHRDQSNIQEISSVSGDNNTNLNNNNPPIQLVPVPINRAIIENIRQEFSLNKQQSLSYNLIANHLLDSLTLSVPPDQLLMFMSGEGGTGKSRVINAVKKLFTELKISHKLRLAAPTGKAASIIGGCTICKLINYSSKNRRGGKCKSGVNRESLEEKLGSVEYLIIDECSMLGCKMFSTISNRLTMAKHSNPDIVFGGINVILVGDFQQFSPVGDKPLYSALMPTHLLQSRQAAIDAVNGRCLFMQFKTVVFLNEQVRQADDLAYLSLLQRTRFGEETSNDHKELLSVTLENCEVSKLESSRNTRIIVSRNDLKSKINNIFVKQLASKDNRKLHYYVAQDKYKKMKEEPHQSFKKTVLSLPDNKTSNLMGVLPLCINMPVMVTNNVAVSLNVTNGSTGTLVDIVFDKDIILAILVKLDCSTPFKVSILPENVISITPITSEFKYFFKTRNGSSRSVTVERTQLPIVPNYATTNYKCQGETLDSAIIDLTPAPRQKIDSSFAYVPLSRVKTFPSVMILRDFPIRVLTQGITLDLKNDLSRLQDLANETEKNCNLINS
jgi:hypothetical protein